MTTPISEVMPYGVTLNPSGTQGTFLTFENVPATHRVGTSGLKLPPGVVIIRVVSGLSGTLRMQYVYTDGSPLSQFEIIPSGGGSYFETVSGENVSYVQFISTTQAVDRAVGRRATVQIIPIPNPT